MSQCPSTRDFLHQEFCFNDSKFIFYIDQPIVKPPHRPTTTLTTRRRQSQKFPLIKKNPDKQVTAGLQSRRANMHSISNRVAMKKIDANTTHRYRRQSKAEAKKDVKKENIKPKPLASQYQSPLKVKPLNFSSVNSQQNASHQTAYQSPIQSNNQACTLQELNKQPVFDARALLGEHHLLLRKDIDYLCTRKKQPISEPTSHCVISTATHDLGHQYKRLMKVNTSTDNPTTLRVSSQYMENFHLERAPILAYLKNILSAQRNLYYRFTKPDSEQLRDNLHADYPLQKQIQWTKILPYSCMNLFADGAIKVVPHNRCPCKENVPFVQFLKAIYHLHPELIKRLVEPPVSNIYSVWLFNPTHNAYQSVVVDPYFPLHEGAGEMATSHCCTQGYPYMWLPILIKAILKTLNSSMAFGGPAMRAIKVSQVYHMLTGLDLQQLKSSQLLKPEGQRDKLVVISDEGLTYFFSSKKDSHHRAPILPLDDEENQIDRRQFRAYNPCSGQVRTFTLAYFQNRKLYRLPQCTHWFIYSVSPEVHSLTKYELETERNTDFIMQHPFEEIRVYLYQQTEQNSHKSKFVLKMEGELNVPSAAEAIKSLKFKVKAGKYKLFVEHGQKRIHLLFNKSSGKDGGQWTQGPPSSQKTVSLCIQCSNQVKMGEGQVLQRNAQGMTEDSTFFYQRQSS